MKILALYDIHGNPDALDAVLGDSRAQAPDVVVVGGDAVPGPRFGNKNARAERNPRLPTLPLLRCSP